MNRNDELKAAVERKEAAWKCWVLEIKMKKKDVGNLTKKKRKWLSDVYIRAKKLVNEKF